MKTPAKLKFIILFIIMMNSCNSQTMSMDAEKIDEVLRNEVENGRTPSVQYILFSKEKIIHKFRLGFADIGSQKQVSDLTTYKIFSLTKTFTALAIMQLSEQKLLDIDVSAIKYLPEIVYGSSITVKQLLNHSAGIPNPIPFSWIHLADEHHSFNRDLFFKRIFRKHNETKSEPNEEFSYSNLGYVLLGQIIENVSGISYEEYVSKNIIKKLGLQPEDLSFSVENNERYAVGYQKEWSLINLVLGLFINKSKFMGSTTSGWKPFEPYYVNGAAYGGLIGTPLALVKYGQELLRANSGIISDGSKRLLFTENRTSDGEATGMCLSWFTGSIERTRFYAHSGGGGGYYCELRLYPELGLGSIVMFNRTGISDERFLDKVDKYIIKK